MGMGIRDITDEMYDMSTKREQEFIDARRTMEVLETLGVSEQTMFKFQSSFK